jgi:hypothetical protein
MASSHTWPNSSQGVIKMFSQFFFLFFRGVDTKFVGFEHPYPSFEIAP